MLKQSVEDQEDQSKTDTAVVGPVWQRRSRGGRVRGLADSEAAADEQQALAESSALSRVTNVISFPKKFSCCRADEHGLQRVSKSWDC